MRASVEDSGAGSTFLAAAQTSSVVEGEHVNAQFSRDLGQVVLLWRTHPPFRISLDSLPETS